MIDILPTPSTEMQESASPIISPKGTAKQMDFPDAMREILDGHTITRLSWDSNDEYCLVKNGILSIFTRGALHSWLVSDGDMQGTDWVVMPV